MRITSGPVLTGNGTLVMSLDTGHVHMSEVAAEDSYWPRAPGLSGPVMSASVCLRVASGS